ncbi:MAG: hypothetical protein EOM67_10740 [Spirochaetia bacterium]|nr:hypothetical protein [Spirochaetia bacterium]
MQFNNVKKNLMMSIAVFIIMIILLILFSIGETTPIKTMFIVIVLAASLVIIGIIWATYFNEIKALGEAQGNEQLNEVNSVIVHTGSQCEIPGRYQCVEHSHREVNMKLGRRFPPCKGEDKGHSTDWKLMKKAPKKQM